MSEFLAMGGYALWVWSAWGLTAIVMVINVIAARSRLHQTVRRARAAHRDERGD